MLALPRRAFSFLQTPLQKRERRQCMCALVCEFGSAEIGIITCRPLLLWSPAARDTCCLKVWIMLYYWTI